MDCARITNDILLDLARGAGGAEERVHVEACARCHLELDAVRSLAADLERLGRATRPAEDPAAVNRVLARIPGARKPRAGRLYSTRRSAWPWVGAAAAAAVAVAVALVLATRGPEGPRPNVAVTEEERPSLDKILDPLPPPPRETPLEPPAEPPRPAPAPPQPEKPAPRPVDPAPARPIEPDRPAPKVPDPAPPPVEAPKPAPAPSETRPARVFLTVAKVEGTLELQDGKAWKKADKLGDWEEGRPVRSGDRLARLTLADGTRVSLRPRTELHVVAAVPPTLHVETGEVFCDVPPAPGRRFVVRTPEASVQVTGTQFLVKRSDHTEVVVAAGEVVVSNEKGEVTLPAGTGTSARKSGAPARPKAIDADGATAWRRLADPPETPRFRYDFEDGRLPYPWTTGKVVAGPARGFNRHVLEGSPGINADLTRVDRRVPVVKLPMKFRFRYYAAAGDEITVQFSTERVRDNFRFDVKPLVHGKWETVEASLSDFYRMVDRASKLEDGDRFGWLNFAVWGTPDPIYFDDIEFVEVLK